MAGGLTWRRKENLSAERWTGVDEDGRVVGHVGDMVTHEHGMRRTYSAYWQDRRRAPDLVDLGYSFDSAESAMAAVVVRDDQQGRGLCTLLLDFLADYARREGVTHLFAETLPENTAMLHVLRNFTPGATSRYEEGAVHVTVPLGGPTNSR